MKSLQKPSHRAAGRNLAELKKEIRSGYALLSPVNFFDVFYRNRRKYWFRKNCRLPVFDALTLLGCPEHDWTISGKCVSVCGTKNLRQV